MCVDDGPDNLVRTAQRGVAREVVLLTSDLEVWWYVFNQSPRCAIYSVVFPSFVAHLFPCSAILCLRCDQFPSNFIGKDWWSNAVTTKDLLAAYHSSVVTVDIPVGVCGVCLSCLVSWRIVLEKPLKVLSSP